MCASDVEWIVPFKGRNYSGSVTQNFLCKIDNIYIMDNHRAALWCWAREINLKESHSILHIDRHYDSLGCRLSETMESIPPIECGIDEYLGAKNKIEGFPLIRWDNYFSIYIDKYRNSINKIILATYDDGDKPDFDSVMHVNCWDVPYNVSILPEKNGGPWILNVDLDYFYYNSGDDYEILFSDAYIRNLFSQLAEFRRNGLIKIFTLCLTPSEYTPGWIEVEKLMCRIINIMGYEFTLPSRYL